MKVSMKKGKAIRFLVIAIAFMLVTIAGVQTASAEETPAIIPYTGSNKPQGMPVIGNDIDYNTVIDVNGTDGPDAKEDATQPGSNSIIDMDQVSSLSQKVYIHNKSQTKTYALRYVIGLPRYYNPNSSVVAGSIPYQATADSGGYGGTPMTDNPNVKVAPYMYVDNKSSDPSNLRAIALNGTVTPGQTIELTIPLNIENKNSLKAGEAFSIFNTWYATTGAPDEKQDHTIQSYASFGKRRADVNGNGILNMHEKYLATTTNSDGTFTILPNDIQKLMPVMNTNNDIKINDFPGSAGDNNADYQNANDTQLYSPMGNWYIKVDAIRDAVKNVGYSTLTQIGDEPVTDFYSYTTAVRGSLIDPNTGKPIQNPEDVVYNLYVPLRQVINAHDSTISTGSTWKPADNATIYDHNGKAVDLNSSDVKISQNVNSSVPGKYSVTYEYIPDGVTKTITVTVAANGSTGGSTSGGTTTTTPTTPATQLPTNTNPAPSTSIPGQSNSNSTPTTTPSASTSVTSNIAVKGEAVYAIKKVGLYKNTHFTKTNRVAWYPKQKRVNRPMFVVTGYKRTSNGTLRYKVRDVNHGRKTAGKKGYITASRKYVVPVYYASVPKSKKITVISRKGVNTYKSANLTGKAKHYKKGARLTVKKLVKHNLTTRYQLSNGHFVTANKKLVIAGNY